MRVPEASRPGRLRSNSGGARRGRAGRGLGVETAREPQAVPAGVGDPAPGRLGPDAGVDGAGARPAVPRSAPGVALRAELSSAWLRRSVGAGGRARCLAQCPRCPSPACARGKSSDARPVPLPVRKERG